ncbi:MAG: riboflavin kinase [Candidatus Peribacteraceae bacterium]|jgi:FAD synthase
MPLNPLSSPIPLHLRVTSGSKRGTAIGTPTLNADLHDVPKNVPHGIYAGTVRVDESVFAAAIHYGPRFFHNDTPSFEVHVIDHTITKTPKTIDVLLLAHLRDVQNFASQEALQVQISADIAQARSLFPPQ